MADPLIDGELGPRDDRGGILAGADLGVAVFRAMGHQHGQLQFGHHVAGIERTAAKAGPHLGQHHHIEREHGLIVVGARLPGEAAVQEASRCRDVDDKILGCHQRQVLDIVANQGGINLDRSIDEVDAGKLVCTVGRKIIRDHAAGIGPADQHRAFEPGGVDHRLHLVTPGLGIPVMRGIQRLVGIAVPAQIVGHDAKLLGEVAVDLAHPRQMTL